MERKHKQAVALRKHSPLVVLRKHNLLAALRKHNLAAVPENRNPLDLTAKCDPAGLDGPDNDERCSKQKA